MYAIEVRYLSLMSTVTPLQARVFCPFQSGVSFVDLFFFMFHVSLCYMPSCPFLAALWSPSWRDWPFVCGVFLVFLLPSHVVSRVGCGALLYQLLILVFFFTWNNKLFV